MVYYIDQLFWTSLLFFEVTNSHGPTTFTVDTHIVTNTKHLMGDDLANKSYEIPG